MELKIVAALLALTSAAPVPIPAPAKAPEGVHESIPPVVSAKPENLDLTPVKAYDGKVFARAYASDVLASALVQPSFDGAFATGIRKSRDSYRVFYMRQWPTIRTLFGHADERDMKTCDVAINDDLAGRVLDVWKRMLLRVHASHEISGLDGTIYDFAMKSPHGELRGEAWSPVPDGRLGKFVAVADTLANYCLASEAWFVPGAGAAMAHRLDDRVTELKSRIPK